MDELGIHAVYTCWVTFLITSIDSNSIPSSKRVKLTSSQPPIGQVQISSSIMPFLDRWRQMLMNFYLKQKSSSDVWPPLKSTQFVQLALVGQKEGERHIGLQTIRKDIDEVYGHKNHMEFSDLFQNFNHSTLVLFEGRPGSGKTTLMMKISCDWAKGLILKSKLVLLVQLRRFGGKSNVYLHDLLKVACSGLSSEDIRGLSSYIEGRFGEDVVFILDGFDEYAPGASDDNFISKVMLNHVCSRSIVIVSSRPAATQRFRQVATKWIEVVGFKKEQVLQYVNTYFKSNKLRAQQLRKHLEQHPDLMNLCYLPLHCAMLVFLYEDDDFLPRTETDFYKHFTLSTLFRTIRKRKDSSHSLFQLPSFDELPCKEKALFDKICKLAFRATVDSQQLFKHSELKDIVFHTQDGAESTDEGSLGLVVIDRYFVRYGLEETYSFLHLTFQEYLAAVHLASLSELELKDTFSNIIADGNEHLTVMWRFLCGMMDFSSTYAMDIFKLIISSTSGILFRIACAYEAQNTTACNHFLHGNCLSIHDHTTSTDDLVINASDMMHIAYVINNVDSQTPEIYFRCCEFGLDEAVTLLQCIGGHQVSLRI